MRVLSIDFANATLQLRMAELAMLAEACEAAGWLVSGLKIPDTLLPMDDDDAHREYETMGALLNALAFAVDVIGDLPEAQVRPLDRRRTGRTREAVATP